MRKRKPSRADLRRKIQQADVPCDGCTLCCETDMILLHPEFGDRTSDYQVAKVDTPSGVRWMIAHAPEGGCIYLDRANRRCRIYHNRPAICREFDCREMARRFDEGRYGSMAHLIGGDVLDRGHALLAKIGGE